LIYLVRKDYSDIVKQAPIRITERPMTPAEVARLFRIPRWRQLELKKLVDEILRKEWPKALRLRAARVPRSRLVRSRRKSSSSLGRRSVAGRRIPQRSVRR